MSLVFVEKRFTLLLPIADDGVIPMLQDEGVNLANSINSWVSAYQKAKDIVDPCNFQAILTEKIRLENPRYNRMYLNQAIENYLVENDAKIKRWIRDISFHDSTTREAFLDAFIESSFVRNLEVLLLPQKDFPYYDGENSKKALACNILIEKGIKCWDETKQESVKPLSPIQNIHQDLTEALDNSFLSFKEEENKIGDKKASPKIKIEINDKTRSSYNVPTVAQLPRDSVNQSSSTNPLDPEDIDKTNSDGYPDPEDKNSEDEEEGKEIKLGWNDDPPVWAKKLMDLAAGLTDPLMKDKLYGAMDFKVIDAESLSQRKIPTRYQLPTDIKPFDDENYQNTIKDLQPKFEFLKDDKNIKWKSLDEVKKIREYLMKRGNKSPSEAIPCEEIDTFCDLFNIKCSNFGKLSWHDIVDLILRKYWQLNIEEEEDVRAARIHNSLSAILRNNGPFQLDINKVDNHDRFIIWIKNFKQCIEDYGPDEPLPKTLKHWWQEKHHIRGATKEANYISLPLGEDLKFKYFITNSRGLTFNTIKEWIKKEFMERDSIELKKRSSLIPNKRTNPNPFKGNGKANANAQTGAATTAKSNQVLLEGGGTTPKAAGGITPKEPPIATRPCDICKDLIHLHFGLTADGKTVTCQAAIDSPKLFEKAIKDAKTKREKRIASFPKKTNMISENDVNDIIITANANIEFAAQVDSGSASSIIPYSCIDSIGPLTMIAIESALKIFPNLSVNLSDYQG